jgi:hypothetical protein
MPNEHPEHPIARMANASQQLRCITSVMDAAAIGVGQGVGQIKEKGNP